MKFKNLLLLLLLASLWGPSFLFIKVAVADIPPVTLVAGRVGIAAVLLYLFLRIQGGHLPRSLTVWKHLAFVALTHNSLPFILFSWGEQHVDSALASILNGTTPLFTILLAHFFTEDDRLTPVKIMGVLFGLGGLVMLILPSLADGFRATTWGLLAMVLAAAFYGVALVYSRNHLRDLPPLAAPTGQMIMATIYVLPLALLVERPYLLPAPSLQSTAALVALSLFGTVLAFIVYYRLVNGANASYVSMVTYLVPIFGIILGVLVLEERISWHAYAGCALILLGVMIVNGVFKRVAWRQLAWDSLK